MKVPYHDFLKTKTTQRHPNANHAPEQANLKEAPKTSPGYKPGINTCFELDKEKIKGRMGFVPAWERMHHLKWFFSPSKYVASSGHKAVALHGKEIHIYHADSLNDQKTLMHEYFHILQQNGGYNEASKQSIGAQQAEVEVEAQIKNAQRGKKVTLSRTDAPVLYQTDPKEVEQAKPNDHEASAEGFDFSSDDPKIGTGRCIVLYLEQNGKGENIESDNKTFKRVAERLVKNRPGRCFGLNKSGKVVVDNPVMYKTGEDIIQALEKVAEQEGKIAEVYIIGHGYPSGVIDADFSSKGLLRDCDKSKKGKYLSDCRDVDAIKAIAPKAFTKNVNIVFHACDLSREVNDANNRKSFAETLYKELAETMKSREINIYGHDDFTMAGFNCNWFKHNVDKPYGVSNTITTVDENGKEVKIPNPEFNMPIELQLGNHETCDKKSGYIGVR
jgi:hypothetical protein